MNADMKICGEGIPPEVGSGRMEGLRKLASRQASTLNETSLRLHGSAIKLGYKADVTKAGLSSSKLPRERSTSLHDQCVRCQELSNDYLRQHNIMESFADEMSLVDQAIWSWWAGVNLVGGGVGLE